MVQDTQKITGACCDRYGDKCVARLSSVMANLHQLWWSMLRHALNITAMLPYLFDLDRIHVVKSSTLKSQHLLQHYLYLEYAKISTIAPFSPHCDAYVSATSAASKPHV